MMTHNKTMLPALLTLVLVLFLLGGCKKDQAESESAVQSVPEATEQE
jgi:hypothetical protein